LDVHGIMASLVVVLVFTINHLFAAMKKSLLAQCWGQWTAEQALEVLSSDADRIVATPMSVFVAEESAQSEGVEDVVRNHFLEGVLV
jgi:hypothetical protein